MHKSVAKPKLVLCYISSYLSNVRYGCVHNRAADAATAYRVFPFCPKRLVSWILLENFFEFFEKYISCVILASRGELPKLKACKSLANSKILN